MLREGVACVSVVYINVVFVGGGGGGVARQWQWLRVEARTQNEREKTSGKKLNFWKISREKAAKEGKKRNERDAESRSRRHWLCVWRKEEVFVSRSSTCYRTYVRVCVSSSSRLVSTRAHIYARSWARDSTWASEGSAAAAAAAEDVLSVLLVRAFPVEPSIHRSRVRLETASRCYFVFAPLKDARVLALLFLLLSARRLWCVLETTGERNSRKGERKKGN